MFPECLLVTGFAGYVSTKNIEYMARQVQAMRSCMH